VDEGHVHVSLRACDTEKVDTNEFTWNRCFSPRTYRPNSYIGSLRFEGKDLTFWSKHAAFVEVYSNGEDSA